MSDWMIDPQVSASLDAWRQSSRRTPRRHARERAQDAMLDAITVASRRPRTRNFFSLRPRFAHAGLIASTATIVAAASVAAAGWNAPPGSALFAIRAARQGVMLKLPGSNDAALHLEFAEQSLADARARINPVQSLANAATELDEAFRELSSDPSSPLFPRYHLDEATLLSEESGFETEGPSPRPASAPSEPGGDDTPGASQPAHGEDEPSPRPPSPTTGDGSPSASGDYGGGGGGDGGGRGTSPSPGQSPPPDN
jgi:hypothetical protein